jgi:hypothetical protein
MANLIGQQFGFVAQEVQPVIPQWVSVGEDGLKQLTLRGFEALAVESVREIKTVLDQLQARIDEIEKRKDRSAKSKNSD